MILTKRFVATLAAVIGLSLHAQGGTIFEHDFENAPTTPTAVTAVGDLGAPAAGSFSFSGSPVGGISNARPAFAVSNGGSPPNMTQMAINSVTPSGVFPETLVADAGGGDRLFADFSSAGGFTAGAKTEISFNMASFGNSNTGTFKYQFVRGLDAADNEVFELLLVSGSGAATREWYARGAGDDSTTLTAANAGTPDGTLLADGFQFQFNGTNVANGRPSGVYQVGILLEDGMVTFDVTGSGGSFTNTAANGMAMPVNSAATSISRLEFSSVWNSAVDTQNKGYWLDDLTATTIPEPTSALLGLIGLTGSSGFRSNRV